MEVEGGGGAVSQGDGAAIDDLFIGAWEWIEVLLELGGKG